MSLATDGVPTDAECDATYKRASELFDEIHDRIVEDDDPGGMTYDLFIILVRNLTVLGWTAEELARDAAYHANDQGAEGRA